MLIVWIFSRSPACLPEQNAGDKVDALCTGNRLLWIIQVCFVGVMLLNISKQVKGDFPHRLEASTTPDKYYCEAIAVLWP